MSIDDKYELFRKDYFENTSKFVEEHLKKYPKIASLLLSELSPLTKEEWLKRELNEAIEEEHYEYCGQLKIKLDELQEDVRGDGIPATNGVTQKQ